MNKYFFMGFVVILMVFCLSNSAVAADIELAEGSTLEGILRRGKLRVGMEAGYMPFEFIDKMQGLRKRDMRAAGIRKGKQYVNIIGFDVDIAREMARGLGVKLVLVNTLWPSIIPALNLGRYDIIMSGMSVTEERKKRIDFTEPLMTIGQTILLKKKHKGV
ncbi:MAG: transporter substrate-binding domain-containing protein, partial [Desulfobacteraceae bacterium]